MRCRGTPDSQRLCRQQPHRVANRPQGAECAPSGEQTCQPPPSCLPAASQPPPSRLPAASQPPPSHLLAVSQPPPSRLPAVSQPSPSRLPAVSQPPPSRLPAASQPSPSRLPAVSQPSPSRLPAASQPFIFPRSVPRREVCDITRGSVLAGNEGSAAIFLPFHKRNVISAEIKTKATTDLV
ncbi:hypothetical protein CgunFtcFv8_025242 [Champsocephalus gunnari]|uniref:Uncharacterized protein n=1 Tax=Champsocephalus gunnari TaxID=52237 RepID=A0AAN8C9Z8_CHAGU|nr:hypothetical protein CgunFtcFv8_025242 [Champsocephalus gunnari]